MREGLEVTRRRLTAAALVAAGAMAFAACGARSGPPAGPPAASPPASLVAQARPIGRGGRFHPPAHGPVLGGCRRSLGRRFGVHVELFAANRVVLLPAGIGTRAARLSYGRVVRAGCYGTLVALDPTGLILLRAGERLTLADLFRSWGQRLGEHRLAGFSTAPGQRVRVFVDGRPDGAPVATVPLRRHTEIVLEVGPYVPPHRSYAFPGGW